MTSFINSTHDDVEEIWQNDQELVALANKNRLQLFESPAQSEFRVYAMFIMVNPEGKLFIVDGANDVISFCKRSAIPGYIVDPPERTILVYKSLRISISHFVIELYTVS